MASAQVDDEAPSPRCRHLHATAESQAYLLVSPTLWVEGVHVPNVGDESGMAVIVGGAWQLRAALSWSPIDLARGLMMIDQAGTECRLIGAAERIRAVLELGDGLGELAARREERRTLVDATESVRALVAHVEEQLERGVGTRSQLTNIQAEALRLSRRISQLDAEIARMVEAGHEDVDATHLMEDLELYESSAVALEDDRSTMRRLSPWIVSIRGGVIPGDRVDWFGQVQVGLNFGIFAQQVAENAVVAARRDELAEDDGELRDVLDRMIGRLRAGLPGLRDELAHVETLMELQRAQRALLGDLETSDAQHTRALIDLLLVGLDAERAHLVTLIEARERALETELHEAD